MWAWILKKAEWLCHLRTNFTDNELELLMLEYKTAPVPLAAFNSVYMEKNSEAHVTALLEVMRGFPEWKVSQHARDILNGTHQWKRWIGFSMFKLLTVKSECLCCSGWRALFLILIALGVGFSAGRLHRVWG